MGMDDRWKLNRIKLRISAGAALVLLYHHHLVSLCYCLNNEGMALLKFRERVAMDPFGALSNWVNSHGEMDHCWWFGVECSHDGLVATLNLRDQCLWGTLSPELGKLTSLKSVVLRNNSFSGNVPEEMVELKELEVFDLGYNNISGPFPSGFGSMLLLDNNKFIGDMSPELHELQKISEFQVDQRQLPDAAREPTCNRGTTFLNTMQPKNAAETGKRILQVVDAQNPSKGRTTRKNWNFKSSPSTSYVSDAAPLSSISFPPKSSISESPFSSPSESPTGNHLIISPTASILPKSSPSPSHFASLALPALTPPRMEYRGSNSKHRTVIIACGVTGASVIAFISVISVICCRCSKVVTVKPWATKLSSQLQREFVTGVPRLKLSELETACEDFSNIIGSLSDSTVYKGTLSSGVEIAVTSRAIPPGEWSKNLEVQFRKKIDTLSRVSHKNFLNLIGYCEEEEPFKRMMVFEYAPNGTLFEHLHIKEAENLNWATRLRIAMGIAYCLDYMHQLTPPIIHRHLLSSTIYLTEDYAAKISYFSFSNKVNASKMGSADMELLKTSSESAVPESDIYDFGVILFELVTGRLSYAASNGCLMDWASNYLNGRHPIREMLDPTLFKSFKDDELEKLFQVIKLCVHSEPKQRPKMGEITAMLKEITKMGPDGAAPKTSLWWAELEIMSSEAI